MKFIIIIVALAALIGATSAVPSARLWEDGERDCNQNLEDGLGPFFAAIWELVPVDDALRVFLEYAADDEEVISILEYLETEEFISILEHLNSIPEYIEILEYFCVELKFDAYFYLNSVADIFGFPFVQRPDAGTPPAVKVGREGEGFQGLIDDITALLPTEEISELWDWHYNNDEYLIRAIEKLRSDTFRVVAEEIEELEAFKNASERLGALGFDVPGIIESMKRWLGWIE